MCVMLCCLAVNFTNCDRPRNDVFAIDGAVIASQASGFSLANNIDCTITFQVKKPLSYTLVHVVHFL